MSRDVAEGHQVGVRPLSVWAQTVELLTRRHGDCIQLEARIRRARRELGSARSDGLQRALREIEADLGGGGSSDDGIPLGAAITEFVRRSRGDVPEAERLGDLESAGVLAEIARVAETWLWCLSTEPDNVRMVRQLCSEAMR